MIASTFAKRKQNPNTGMPFKASMTNLPQRKKCEKIRLYLLRNHFAFTGSEQKSSCCVLIKMEVELQSEKIAICRIGLTHNLQEQVTMDNLLL